MENIQNKAQVRLVARAGRRTAERARRKRITIWKSPSQSTVEKRLFDDNSENYPPPEKEDMDNHPKIILKGIKSPVMSVKVKVKKTARFKVSKSPLREQVTTPKAKKMPSVRTPAEAYRDKRKAMTPLSARSLSSIESPYQSQECASPICDDNYSETASDKSPTLKKEDVQLNSESLQYSKKDKSTNTINRMEKSKNNKGFISPNSFLRKHPYPQHYQGVTPGAIGSPKESECESDWDLTVGINESFGDLSINDSREDDDVNDDDVRESPSSVKSGKWCKRLNETIEAVGITGIDVPEHLRCVSSYAEPWVEGESDLSEWESDLSDSDSDESFE